MSLFTKQVKSKYFGKIPAFQSEKKLPNDLLTLSKMASYYRLEEKDCKTSAVIMERLLELDTKHKYAYEKKLLGMLYLEGSGVEKDTDKGGQLLREYYFDEILFSSDLSAMESALCVWYEHGYAGIDEMFRQILRRIDNDFAEYHQSPLGMILFDHFAPFWIHQKYVEDEVMIDHDSISGILFHCLSPSASFYRRREWYLAEKEKTVPSREPLRELMQLAEEGEPMAICMLSVMAEDPEPYRQKIQDLIKNASGISQEAFRRKLDKAKRLRNVTGLDTISYQQKLKCWFLERNKDDQNYDKGIKKLCGLYISVNTSQAIDFFKSSAMDGNAKACRLLAHIYTYLNNLSYKEDVGPCIDQDLRAAYVYACLANRIRPDPNAFEKLSGDDQLLIVKERMLAFDKKHSEEIESSFKKKYG